MYSYKFENYEDLACNFSHIKDYLVLSLVSDEKIQDIKLIIYELVTNVLKHSKCCCLLSFEDIFDGFLVLKIEGKCTFKQRQIVLPCVHSECGRGLFLVSNLCVSLEYIDGGKVAICKIKI